MVVVGKHACCDNIVKIFMPKHTTHRYENCVIFYIFKIHEAHEFVKTIHFQNVEYELNMFVVHGNNLHEAGQKMQAEKLIQHAHVVLLCFSIAMDTQSFTKAMEDYYCHVGYICDTAPAMMLVGCKVDAKRGIGQSDIDAQATKWGVKHVSTSAKLLTNVSLVFETAIQVYEANKQKPSAHQSKKSECTIM